MRTESSLDLTRRIAAVNAVACQLIAESAHLRKQAANLRSEYARVRIGSCEDGTTEPAEVVNGLDATVDVERGEDSVSAAPFDFLRRSQQLPPGHETTGSGAT